MTIAKNPEVREAIDLDYLADLNVHFQRLLTLSERASVRSRYEGEISAVLKKFTTDLIIPLKQVSRSPASNGTLRRAQRNDEFTPTAFLAHSFAASDDHIVLCVKQCLEAIGLTVITGEKPKADKISEKIKRRIDEQHLFVGLFTRRAKIAGSSKFTTSAWIIDEKAYAVAREKKLILVREIGVDSIGGIQGDDYEFIEFARDRLHELPVRLLELFEIAASGLGA